MDIKELIRPELIVLIPFINLIGVFLKKAFFLEDKYIPSVLWVISVAFSFLYMNYMVESTLPMPQVLILSAVQGTFIAAVAVFGNQQVKQLFSKK